MYVYFSKRWGWLNILAASPNIFPFTRISRVDRLCIERPWDFTIWVLNEKFLWIVSRWPVGNSSLSHTVFHFCWKCPRSVSSLCNSCVKKNIKVTQSLKYLYICVFKIIIKEISFHSTICDFRILLNQNINQQRLTNNICRNTLGSWIDTLS